MSSQTIHTPIRILAGYAAATLTAAAATVSLSMGAPDFSGASFAFILAFALFYVGVSGLPGFVAIAAVAERLAACSARFYAAAGSLNATVAWMFAGGLPAFSTMGSDALFVSSLVGGAAGGVAYWSIAVRPRYEAADMTLSARAR